MVFAVYRAAWRARRPRASSFSGVSQSEEGVILARSILPGQGRCKSKELSKKPLTNPQNSPTRKKITCNYLLTPFKDSSFNHCPVQPSDKHRFPFFFLSSLLWVLPEREITGSTSELGKRGEWKDPRLPPHCRLKRQPRAGGRVMAPPQLGVWIFDYYVRLNVFSFQNETVFTTKSD